MKLKNFFVVQNIPYGNGYSAIIYKPIFNCLISCERSRVTFTHTKLVCFHLLCVCNFQLQITTHIEYKVSLYSILMLHPVRGGAITLSSTLGLPKGYERPQTGARSHEFSSVPSCLLKIIFQMVNYHMNFWCIRYAEFVRQSVPSITERVDYSHIVSW